MYDFSMSVLEVINQAEERSNSSGHETLGSEYLLSEMAKIEDGIFHFLMNEYNVDISEVEDETNKVIVLRNSHEKYSDALIKIFDVATSVSYGKIKEEHLLYGILETKESIAYKIIRALGLSPQDLLLDLKEIYDFKEKEVEIKYTHNLTKRAKEGLLDGLYEYDDYLKRMLVILNKKYKNNPLIIGEAGVGKTALVEGFAKYSYENNLNYEVLSLNLSQMLSNTKYRGDFESRLDEAMKYITSNPNAVLFIDEVHTIIGTGASENSLDVANILKPYLARSEIKIIGATTLDEYQKTIFKDKALRRRFDPIVLHEPSLVVTNRIMLGIKASYEKYHKILISNDVINYLCKESDKRILNKARPDKCIDILDEMMSYAKINSLPITCDLVDKIIDERIGVSIKSKQYHYKEINKLIFLKENHLKEESKYNYHLAIYENETSLEYLKEDLKILLGITDEMILSLDARQYQDESSMQALIGAPPGYVGYEEEGIISGQLLKYPLSLLIIQNSSALSGCLKRLIESILTYGYFLDNKGNRINTKHLVILDIITHNEESRLGFKSESARKKLDYDLVIDDNPKSTLNDLYEKIFARYKLPLHLDFSVMAKHKNILNQIIYEQISSNDNKAYNVVLDGDEIRLKSNWKAEPFLFFFE